MSVGPAPEPDHAAALRWAASFREFRDGLRAALSDGSRSLTDVLAGGPDDADAGLLGETKLLGVLESLPGARKTDTRRTLEELGIDGSTRIGALCEGQRATLLATFPLSPSPSDIDKEPSS